MQHRILLAIGVSLTMGCKTKDDTHPQACGDMVCGEREVCDESGREPRCECAEAYTGDECESCAPGYELVDDSCEAVSIDCEDSPCGLHGACVSQSGQPDRCECNDLYTGPTCRQCVDGYQDNDGDGTCAMGCDNADLPFTCDGMFVCDDLSGEAMCVCPVGSAGEACELCEAGYARKGDDPCYETCASADFECEDPKYCFDDGGLQAARCLCPWGYAGDDCSMCAEGFSADGDACVITDRSGFELLALAPHLGRTTVMGLGVSTGALTPLLAVDGSPEGLVYDASTDTLYVANHVGVHRVDWRTGELTQIVAEQIGHGKPLAHDSATHALFTFTSSNYDLVRIDAATGTRTTVASSGLSWLWDATWRAADEQIYAVRSQGLTPSIHRVNPADAMTTELGIVSDAAPLGSDGPGGLAALANGDLALLGRSVMSEEAAIIFSCVGAAERLGYGDYGGAPANLVQSTAPATILSGQGVGGKEVVAYYAYGGSGDNVITIAVDNPEAFICILTYQEDFEVAIDANAQWAGGIIYTYQSMLSASVPSSFAVDAPLLAAGGSNASLTALEAEPAVFRVLSAAEFADRKVPSLSDFSGVVRREAPYVLQTLSLPDLTQKTIVAVEGDFRGGLCSYE